MTALMLPLLPPKVAQICLEAGWAMQSGPLPAMNSVGGQDVNTMIGNDVYIPDCSENSRCLHATQTITCQLKSTRSVSPQRRSEAFLSFYYSHTHQHLKRYAMTRLFHLLGLTFGLIAAISLSGCGTGGEGPSTPASEADADHDHDHDHDGDHDHDHADHEDHDGHDHSAHEHPEHGLNGGHMVKLEDGSEIEVALNKEDDAFAIFPATPADVSSIKMISKVGEEETTYEFAASESEDSAGAFLLTSPELATAVRMGDTVEVTLVVETKDGSTSAKYQHHEH